MADVPIVAWFAISTVLNCLILQPAMSGVGVRLGRLAGLDPSKAERFANALMTFGHKAVVLSIAFSCFSEKRWAWPSACGRGFCTL